MAVIAENLALAARAIVADEPMCLVPININTLLGLESL